MNEITWKNKQNRADKGTAILIGAGEMGKKAPMISKEDYVIALDGGLVFCDEHGIEPDMIVGDFDSLPDDKQKLPDKYPQEIIRRLPCEKDDTDTLAAVKLAISEGFDKFKIYGGVGGRLSHTIANIQSLLYLKERKMQGELIGDRSRIFLLKNESCVLEAEESAYLSVFSYSERAEGVTLKNLKYEIRNAVLTNTYPLGVSNEFIGNQAEISVENGILLVIIEDKA